MNKFEGLPTIHYVSIEESLDRRKNLEEQFKKYNITNFVPHIFKRYEEGDYVINGPLVHLLAEYSKAGQSSHFLLLRDWYDNYDDPYILVFEDDLSLDTSLYWNFTWKEFEDNLPNDWDCVQLCIIDEKPREQYFFQVRDCNNDWSAAAYLIKRDYAKYLLDRYYSDGTFNLDIKEYNCVPVLEQSLFLNERGHVYSFPLFVEDNYKFVTTNKGDSEDEYNLHHISYDSVMSWWKNIGSSMSIKSLLHSDNNIEEMIPMNELLEFSLDTDNGKKNYDLATWYENQGHTAPAHTYYLRASENTTDKILAYKALIRASFCYKSQGSRDITEKILLENALVLIPNRPEAYYFLSLLYERKNEWQNCYIYSTLGLECYEQEIEEIEIPEYQGKPFLIFQKAVSSWWWGKGDESRRLFFKLYKIYWNSLDEKHKKSIIENIKKLDIDIDNNMKWGIPNTEFVKHVSNEVFDQKIYERFYQVKEGDIVVDVGASSGPFTYSILNKNPKKVYCLEPSKNFFEVLQENMKYCPVKCINKAIVSDNYQKEDKLFVFWQDDSNNIDTITFKEFISENNISNIDLLKMDCESGEYDIFVEENLDFLLNNVNNIVAEFHCVWEGDTYHYKFENFKKNILPKFPYYRIYSVGNSEDFDITEHLYSSNYIESNCHQVMIYLSKKPFYEKEKKIIDCFRFFNEKELLELRYNLYKDYVDLFIILEGNRTQSGVLREELLAKKYIEELNLPKEKFKVIEVELPGNDEDIENTEEDIMFRSLSGQSNDTYKNSLNARTRERLLLDSLLNVVSEFNDNDIFLVSDCDEIIKPENIPYFSDMVLKNSQQLIKVPLVELQGRANLRAYNRETNIPISTDNVFFICTKKHFEKCTPFRMRFDINNSYEVVYLAENGKRLEDCGWHFSWMGNSNRLKLKQKSTSHYADKIETALIKDMNSPELEKFIEEWKPGADGFNPWGHKNTLLKEYSLDSLPKQILEKDYLKEFFIGSEEVNSIPIIGVPVVNGVHWLGRLINSIDYPVNEFFIINNSGKDEISEEINQLCKTKNSFIKNIRICNLPANIGVSGAWNLIIKSYIMSPYWIICNNDISFTSGFLEEMVNKSKNPDVGMVHCSSGDHQLGSYECFLLKDWVVEKCGLFDENFYPCYVEDVDYTIRTNLNEVKKDYVNLPMYHGETQDYSQSGSQTWRTDLSLKEKIDNSRILNESEYMIRKWGDEWYSIFRNRKIEGVKENKIKVYDLDFNRKKYLGF